MTSAHQNVHAACTSLGAPTCVADFTGCSFSEEWRMEVDHSTNGQQHTKNDKHLYGYEQVFASCHSLNSKQPPVEETNNACSAAATLWVNRSTLSTGSCGCAEGYAAGHRTNTCNEKPAHRLDFQTPANNKTNKGMDNVQSNNEYQERYGALCISNARTCRVDILLYHYTYSLSQRVLANPTRLHSLLLH